MIGRVVSRYRIIEELGHGGMGVVYKARDIRLERLVALKFLSAGVAENESARMRFMQEARAASALDHPNICTIYGIEDTDDGQMFIAMSCYEGEKGSAPWPSNKWTWRRGNCWKRAGAMRRPSANYWNNASPRKRPNKIRWN